MPVTVLLGAQWGDEGKGKIVDLLSEGMDMVIRFQGGSNAGHTVVIDGKKIVLHQIPTGILQRSCKNVIGNGCVVDPPALVEELASVISAGYSIQTDRLLISDLAHLVTPIHRWIDSQTGAKIGTTGRGIGPCYADKTMRVGIRVCDAQSSDLEERLFEQFHRAEATARANGWNSPPPPDSWLPAYRSALARILPFAGGAGELIHGLHLKGVKILLEGAQGTLLDLDHGTYPFVASSSTAIGGALTGIGVYLPFDVRLGVFKAYTTRVGNGPFPTELTDATGEELRRIGAEYGATTGRPRRCGWLDLFLMRLSCRINGFNRLVITKLDCLSSMKMIKVAVGRDDRGNPIYREFIGWKKSLDGCTNRSRFPAACREFLDFIEGELGVPLAGISIGPERRQTILKDKLWK